LLEKIGRQEAIVGRSLCEASSQQTISSQHQVTDSIEEEQLISITERNSQQIGQRAAIEALVSRQMVWTKTPQMEAWTCFACAWAFIPFGPPRGNSLEEMMSNYERQRDKEYASHVCNECPKLQNTLATSMFPVHQTIENAIRVGSISMKAKA
jgi:hypothetical protein